MFANGGFEQDIYGEENRKFPESSNWYTEGKAEMSQNEVQIDNLSLVKNINE